ncbi:hypothetical protein H2198_001191 [Neophaeococcomyces mojaviensis]|uniref:Uncharacterized protein n=1 Tax=Neophaeococcomyces mojaviensis TaxID=3383035 RepID=A0ACC3AHL9_9EURO|nr:hypothetical protein H2198_001191 [Knufia sp. JES_112]
MSKVRLHSLGIAKTLAASVFALVFYWTYVRLQHNLNYTQHATGQHVIEKINPLPPGTFLNATRPENQTIIGLVFYGRQDRVRLLNCYLERNLPEQGGWLDEVHFVRNTNNETDLAYLDELLATHSRYKMLNLKNNASTDNIDRYRDAWGLINRDTIYVKIDDDVVW